jgi:hypothetical protein
MRYAQEQLLASFPGFVQTIAERLEGFDVHIMAANPDGTWPGFLCQTEDACGVYWPHCTADDVNWDCANSVQEWQPCDSELGAGVTFNAVTARRTGGATCTGGTPTSLAASRTWPVQLECIAAAGTWGDYARDG